jgi:hypothetical protein
MGGFLMAIDLDSLIHEVYRQSKVNHVPPPFVTRVVKIIYLADLEWRRRHGEPLSNIEWRFLHFGPYAYEFVPVLGDPDMEVAEFQGKTARRFVFDPAELEVQRVSEEISGIIRNLVKQWGDADINRLLDYVYFETEPMENARRGDVLDFSTIRPPMTQVQPKFDTAKIKALRSRLKDQVTKLGLTQDGVRIPTSDYEGQRAWDEDASTTALPVGTDVSQDVNAD